MTKTNQQDKGLFLQKFYSVKDIPTLVNEDGSPTKFAEAATYWGEVAPKSERDVKMLVSKGVALTATENLSVSQKFSQNSVYGGRQELSVVRANQIKVPFVKTGAWKHDVYGEVKFTQEDIDELVNNFKSGVTGFTPYLTLGHLDEEPDSTDSHRKRGDLQDIVVEDNVAYGIFDVNDDIYASIQQGEFEYSSGEFNRKFTSKDTGENVGTAVIRVALTNSPFLPFGEDKIQALSDNTETCPETRENYVFLLSIDTSNSSDVSDEEPSTTEAKADEKPEEKAEEALSQSKVEPVEEETKSEEINKPENTITTKESTMPQENANAAVVDNADVNKVDEANKVDETKLETTNAVVKESEASKTVKPAEASVDNKALEALAGQFAEMQKLYKEQLDNANKVIANLTEKVEGLGSQLAGQQKVTQAFSSSMSQAQENAMIQDLQNHGVQPATVQKFLEFKSSFERSDDKNIVKFSQTVGEETKEVEFGVIDTVASMLKAAAAQTPLVEQQLGISAGRKSGAFDFSSIIERNAEAASKIK